MIQLSDHFTYKRLLRFTFPSIIMMIFTSVYGVVDGFFVSNFVGKTPFAAVNLIMPVLMILGCIGFMFGSGGAALISMTMGAGYPKKANEIFSMIVWVSAALGILFGALGFLFLRPIASLLGAEGQLLENCVLYGRIILVSLPFYVLQFEFQCLFATAEKPKLGLYVTVAAGLTNMVLDALFVAVFSWGIAAYGVLMYVCMIFLAIFIGYSVGVAPIVGYHYGARNHDELSGLLKKSLRMIAVCAVVMFAAGQFLASPLSRLFVGYDTELMEITTRAFVIFSFSFLFSGFSIFGSSFFTALNDGLISALIAFLRTLVFQVIAVLVFPLIWGLDGIWFSIVGAEIMAITVTISFLLFKREKYGY